MRTPHFTRRAFLECSALALAGLAPSLGAQKTRYAPPPGSVAPPDPALAPISGLHSLRARADARGLLVGCAVVPQRLQQEPDYAEAVNAQANILVAENAMKWAALHPSLDQFDFAQADALAAFAAAHGQKLRGHNLCWHEALPPWFASGLTSANAREILVKHIETVAGRYAGRIHSWDVVNEAIEPRDGRMDGLRKSPWLELAGPDYIETAFRTARAADPTALLTYNDYAIELDTPEQADKRTQVLMLVRRMKARGVPVDAVGVQSHLMADGPLPGEGLRSFVRELHTLGLQVFVTELDVNDRNVPGTIADRDRVVAAVYREHLRLMLAEPNVTAVLTWGITDRYSWLNASKEKPRLDGQPKRPLPLDADYRPVPAFFAERDAIERRTVGVPGITRPEPPPSDPYAPFTPPKPKD